MTTQVQPQRIELAPRRRLAREVAIGDVALGGAHPIAVQSMTTTFTSDAGATAAQIVELARAGCDIVRVTVPSKRDALALPEIRQRMAAEGVSVPLVADIHFTPKLALQVVEHVEKVRINPGNFVDKKSLGGNGYDESRWEQDLQRAYEMFAPVVDRARELGVALRIGTNHGSLSDRILHRYGDTPEGMVESALEFVRIAEDRGHRDIVLSMKASNVQVMVRAYRLLAKRLEETDSGLLPLHLGVTEAGGGDEGRIKSAAGIATLLGEGLGDTVRVSLTENPVAEVPVGRSLVEMFARAAAADPSPTVDLVEVRDPLDPRRRDAATARLGQAELGGRSDPRVELTVAEDELEAAVAEAADIWPPLECLDLRLEGIEPDWESALAGLAPLEEGGATARAVTAEAEALSRALDDPALAARVRSGVDRIGFVVGDDLDLVAEISEKLAGVPVLAALRVDGAGLSPAVARRVVAFAEAVSGRGPQWMIGLECRAGVDVTRAHRVLAAALDRSGCRAPLVLSDEPLPAGEDARLGVAGRLAPLLLDGQGDAVRLRSEGAPAERAGLAHAVLQACRRRLEQAEYIACPSCGRTRFELEETTERIRRRTAHLRLKIGVMGCVVNGPGEMADADYGFVGWGEGKVALFVGRQMVDKDIPYDDAPDRLVELIKSRGDWTEPREGRGARDAASR
jgi:(E)-4-hydroxy-3-methylbut-2-enyl-diphosphate synthase